MDARLLSLRVSQWEAARRVGKYILFRGYKILLLRVSQWGETRGVHKYILHEGKNNQVTRESRTILSRSRGKESHEQGDNWKETRERDRWYQKRHTTDDAWVTNDFVSNWAACFESAWQRVPHTTRHLKETCKRGLDNRKRLTKETYVKWKRPAKARGKESHEQGDIAIAHDNPKRPAKETFQLKTDPQKRPVVHNSRIRPTKETYINQRNPQKHLGVEFWKAGNMEQSKKATLHITIKRTPQKRPISIERNT